MISKSFVRIALLVAVDSVRRDSSVERAILICFCPSLRASSKTLDDFNSFKAADISPVEISPVESIILSASVDFDSSQRVFTIEGFLSLMSVPGSLPRTSAVEVTSRISSLIWNATPRAIPNRFMRRAISSDLVGTNAPESAANPNKDPVLRSAIVIEFCGEKSPFSSSNSPSVKATQVLSVSLIMKEGSLAHLPKALTKRKFPERRVGLVPYFARALSLPRRVGAASMMSSCRRVAM